MSAHASAMMRAGRAEGALLAANRRTARIPRNVRVTLTKHACNTCRSARSREVERTALQQPISLLARALRSLPRR